MIEGIYYYLGSEEDSIGLFYMKMKIELGKVRMLFYLMSNI